MKKRALVLTIVLSCIVACAVIGISVFGLFFLKNKNKNESSNILTPPTPREEEIIIDPTGYPEIADSVIKSQFDIAPVYDGFTIVGYKINGATSEAVQNGKLIIPQKYKNLPILEIGNAFNNWTEISQMILPNTLVGIATDGNSGSFRGCSSLHSIQFPKGSNIQTVGENAFNNCVSLKSIDLNACAVIKNAAFNNCTELATVSLGNKLQKIGNETFCYTKIKSVSLPASTTQIGTNPFAYSTIETITIAPSNSVYKAENNCIIEKETNKLIVGSKVGQIADDVEIIGENAFAGVSATNVVIIPASTTTICEMAFKDFEGSIVLSEGLKVIKNKAFYGSNVDLEAIPDSVEELGSEVFYGCSNLAETFYARGVTKIGLVVFAGTPVENITLYGGPGFVAETDGENDFKTGSNIQTIIYIVPIE